MGGVFGESKSQLPAINFLGQILLDFWQRESTPAQGLDTPVCNLSTTRHRGGMLLSSEIVGSPATGFQEARCCFTTFHSSRSLISLPPRFNIETSRTFRVVHQVGIQFTLTVQPRFFGGSLNSFKAETHKSQGSQVLGQPQLPRCVYFSKALGWNEGAISIPSLKRNMNL